MKNYHPIFTGGFGRGMSGGIPNRPSNLIQYYSPTFNNFRIVGGYSAGAEAQGTNAPTDGRLNFLRFEGAVGAISGGWDWINNKANSPTPGTAAFTAGNGRGETVANKLRIGWTYQPDALISFLWVGVKQINSGASLGNGQGGLPEAYVPATGAGSNLNQSGWGMEWKHRWGNVQPIAQWGRVTNVAGCAIGNNCANTSSSVWMLGARYLMSKRTWAYASYASINNANNANMDFASTYAASAAGIPGLTAASIGADPRVLAVGMAHMF
jgi:predicted porin